MTVEDKEKIDHPIIYTRDHHCVSRKDIDPDALKIMRRLTRHGFKAYLVGGAVRDLLLNKSPKDYDIATNATPNRIKALFRNCRIIGRRFKLAHIYFKGGKIIEVSTFRRQGDTPELESTEDLSELLITRDNLYGTELTDALRRDLTINALFYNLSDFSVIDYTGGVADLQAGIVRIIGNPEIRFAEDPVRMLRTVRYACRAGFAIEPTCLSIIKTHHDWLTNASPMRLYEEVKKDIFSGCFGDNLQALSECGLLQHLLPELSGTNDALLSSNSFLRQALTKVDQAAASAELKNPTAVLSLLALFGDTGSNLEADLGSRFDHPGMLCAFLKDSFSKLQVPRKEREKIQRILTLWLELDRVAPEKLKVRRISAHSEYEDLLVLLHFLNVNHQYDDALSLLSGVREQGDRQGRRDQAIHKKDRRGYRRRSSSSRDYSS